jgi:hypothetical protein
MHTLRSVVSFLSLVTLARTAGATWPAEGAPVATGAGANHTLCAVVPDGPAALFVAYVVNTSPAQVRVQRLRADGDITPGWGTDGATPTAPTTLVRSNPHVIPDGTGGCFVAWDETNPSIYYYVRVQHLLASGTPDPAWPADGALVAQGDGPFFGIATLVSVAGLVPASSGGCIVAVSRSSSGCHDGFCVSGGSVTLTRADAAGALSPAGALEPFCSSFTEAIVTLDGGGGLFALTKTGCPNEMRFRHTLIGGEPPVPLPVLGFVAQSDIARVADGSVLAKVGRGFLSTNPVWFHWNADGSPAAGAPAGGLVLPAGPSKFAPDGSGTSVFVWQPAGTPGPLFGIRLEPDGSGSPGWPAAGLPLASAPAQVEPFAASSDGAGGVVVVWQDKRAGDSNRDLYAARRFANGAPANGVPASGYPLCTASGHQTNPMVATLAPGISIAAWEDTRTGSNVDLYAQRITLDTPVPTTVSLASVDARPDRVRVEWRLSDGVPEVVLERSGDGNEWNELARIVPGSLGRVEYEDTDVHPGESLAYRIHFLSDGRRIWTVPVWVEIPRAELAVRVMPPTSRDRLSLEVTLASRGPARLDLLDVSGRRLQSHDLSHLGTDPTRLELELADLAPGIAWLRLQQGTERRTVRLAITR